jgi:hypothetical protein
MKLLNFKKYILLLSTFTVFSCQESYMPDFVIDDMQPILIVEGFINTEGGSRFKLSETIPLSAEDKDAAVTNASVSVESSNGTVYNNAMHTGNGQYTVDHPTLTHDAEYRVNIKIGTKEYVSAFVKPQTAPEITSIDWQQTDNGTDIQVSTVNTESGSNFYRWEFEEDWRYSSRFPTYYMFANDQISPRFPEDNLTFCFNRAVSSNILIGSTESFVENRLDKQQVQHIPNLSEKLMYRYTILVKQYSISKASYVYWSILKKNSESVGDIFGSMPSELKGNIVSSSNASEPVIGMIEAGTVTEKRIYINAAEFTPSWRAVIPDYAGCYEEEVAVADAVAFFRQNPNFMVTYAIFKNEASPLPTHYAYSPARCSNCTIRGGSLEAPVFWTDK